MIGGVIDVIRRFIVWALSVFRRTGGDVMNDDYDDQQLVQQYAEGIAIGVSPESVDAAIKDGYDKFSRRNMPPPYRILEIWAHGTNPFTEFRVVMKGGS